MSNCQLQIRPRQWLLRAAFNAASGVVIGLLRVDLGPDDTADKPYCDTLRLHKEAKRCVTLPPHPHPPSRTCAVRTT